MGGVLIVTWLGGGATQPAIGLGRELSARGHRVRVLAPARFAGRIAAAGCEHVAHPAAAEFNTDLGRAMDDQSPFLAATFFGPWLADAMAGQVAADRPDVVVVDCLLRSALCEVEAHGIPLVVLVHMAYRFHARIAGDPEAPWGWRWQYRRVNELRAASGLPPLPPGPEPLSVALARRAGRALVVLPPAFDSWPDPPPSVVHTGPIAEEAGPAPWVPPWPDGDDRPLVVVTCGTTYMHQEGTLRRILGALDGLGVRVLLLTGLELDPAEVPAGPDVCVEAYVPHAAVLPQAAAVISHAGVGSLLEAFRAGVPSVCLPLGRDQADNAAAAAERGAAIALEPGATSGEIRAAVSRALTSPALRRAARRLAGEMAACGGGPAAADEVEQVAWRGSRAQLAGQLGP
jgi:UDP:flavonoid glycosyltransferase YjiC (YdhE family)